MKVHYKDDANEVYCIENSLSAIPILLKLNQKWSFDSITELSQLSSLIQNNMQNIEQLATAAFSDSEKNFDIWNDIQKLLYIWNLKDLFKENNQELNTAFLLLLRNKIIEIEKKFSSVHKLNSFDNFTPQMAIKELYEKANEHRINNHPLLTYMEKNGLNLNAVKIFLENYYVNNRVFHLFVAQQSLFTPMEMRVELYKNLFDELGTGDHDMAHPILFLKNFDTIGHLKQIQPLPETLFLFNTKYYSIVLSGDYHYGTGGLGFIEVAMPCQMMMILAGLRKSQIPEKDLEFWRVHITIDQEHGKAWFNEMEELIHTPEHAQACLNGGLNLLEARAKMYDGIWKQITSNNFV